MNPAGQFVAADRWKVIFNPSFPYRLVHMVLAAYLTTAFVVGAVGAWHLLRDPQQEAARVMFSMAMWMAALVAPVQIVAGDQHGLNTLEHQPAKVMAMEGHFTSHPDGAPLILLGLPDQEAGRVHYPLQIPKASSLILKHSLDAPLAGLDTVPRENWPPVSVVFWSFRVMVALGFLMMGLGLLSLWLRWRGTLYACGRCTGSRQAMGPSGFVAVLAGWITTEAGRQPFTRSTASCAPRIRIAAGRPGGGVVAARLRRRLLHRVRHGRDLHPAPDASAAAPRRDRTARRGAGARRRHHPAPALARAATLGAPRWTGRSTSPRCGPSSSPSRCSCTS